MTKETERSDSVDDHFHHPSLLLEYNHCPWKGISSLGGLMDLLNSLQPPIAEGWSVCCSTEGCSPLGISWNECPLWRTKLGTYASESCRILVVADPDLVNSPISLWAANKGSEPSEPKSLDSFCWYVNNLPRLLEANLQSIMFDLLRGKIKKKLTHLSSPRRRSIRNRVQRSTQRLGGLHLLG